MQDKQLNIDGQSVSLMQIAGVDMGTVEERRFFPFARGAYTFRVKSGELTTKEIKEVEKPAVVFELECIACYVVSETDKPAEDFVGKDYKHEIAMFDDLQEFVGVIKAFIADITGAEVAGDLQNAIANAAGHDFNVNIIHKVDKNDKSKSYPRLALDTIVAVAAAPAAGVGQIGG